MWISHIHLRLVINSFIVFSNLNVFIFNQANDFSHFFQNFLLNSRSLLSKSGKRFDGLVMSSCLVAEICESLKDRFVVAVYNPLSKSINAVIRLPTNKISFSVTGPAGRWIIILVYNCHLKSYCVCIPWPGFLRYYGSVIYDIMVQRFFTVLSGAKMLFTNSVCQYLRQRKKNWREIN